MGREDSSIHTIQNNPFGDFWGFKGVNTILICESCWDFGALKEFSPCFEQLQDAPFKTENEKLSLNQKGDHQFHKTTITPL